MKLINIDNNFYPKLGIYEKAINVKFNWNDKILIAKSAGFDFIEISIDENENRIARLDWDINKINQFHNLLKENDFYINSMCLSANRKYPLGSKDELVAKHGLEIIHKALIFAKHLGIRIIQLAGYDEYYNKNDEITKQNFINNMKTVCSLAQYYSVNIAFESMDTFFMGDLTRILNIIKILDSPMLSIYPDIGNLTQFAKQNFASEIELAKNKIVAFHFKDTTKDKFKCVPFGSGTVDFESALKAIKAINFKGPFMIEMWNENLANQSINENILEIKNAKAFFDSKFKGNINEL